MNQDVIGVGFNYGCSYLKQFFRRTLNIISIKELTPFCTFQVMQKKGFSTNIDSLLNLLIAKGFDVNAAC